MAEAAKRNLGVKHVVVAVSDTTDFKDLARMFERVLTIPDLPGIKGCAPCLSGLDKIVFENPLVNVVR